MLTMIDRPPFTREEIIRALDELYGVFDEWDALVECEVDAEGFPVGDSLEANMKRLISEATSSTSRLIIQLYLRGIEAAPPVDVMNGR